MSKGWEEATLNAGTKRSIEVDPDGGNVIQESKKPRIHLDTSKKVRCLKAIAAGFDAIVDAYFPHTKNDKGELIPTTQNTTAKFNLQISAQVSNIIFTLHTYKRQVAAGKKDTNVITKSATTEFTITIAGQKQHMDRKVLIEIWERIVETYDLKYKVYSRQDDEENWYGTFGPYIDFFCGFGLRLKELRLGHDKMPISKLNGVMIEVPVKKYGLNGAHHILLEGSTFPPEKRSSMAQSVGPMTALLSMIRSEGIYRAKWAAAVKRAFNHIPVIDDIIEITKTQNKAADVSTMIGLLAEILLITTARQASRAFFPIAMFVAAYDHYMSEQEGDLFLEFFNTTGSGAFLTYKKTYSMKWNLSGEMTEETAGQIVFHSIFGTYKEDFGVLSSITDTSTWKTREEMGKCFQKAGTVRNLTHVKLPAFRYYAKLSCANQSGLLSGVYNQVSSMPVFSGTSMRQYGDDFFSHIDKKMSAGSTGKSISQITASLSITLDDFRKALRDKRGKQEMGTTQWKSMETLELGSPGEPVNMIAVASGAYFMGKALKK